MVLVMAEVVAAGRTRLTMVGADCLLEGAVGSVIEIRTVAHTVVQPVQEYSD
jgi:hypothetical protein